MTNNFSQESVGISARIYEFRARPRTASTVRTEQPGAVVQLATKRPVRVDFDAWYHQEALREAENALKQ